jgi:hypothetical protein
MERSEPRGQAAGLLEPEGPAAAGLGRRVGEALVKTLTQLTLWRNARRQPYARPVLDRRGHERSDD